MPDVGHPSPLERAVPIADALRALPLAAPPRSAWPGIGTAAQLDHSRPSVFSRWPHALAAAAAFVASFPAPPAAGVLVHRAADGWRVETGEGAVAVAPPRARAWPGPAADFGADTDRWLA